MIKGFEKYPICFWQTQGWNRLPQEKVDTWNELGITLAMMPSSAEERTKVYEGLNRAQQYGMKAILCDNRTSWRALTALGEEKYREGVKQALEDFGGHPAVFGFHIGDEPDAADAGTAFKAMRINNELAPHLTAYLNILPWFDWIGERMGTDTYANYIDRMTREGAAKLVSYDCYAQMWEDKERAYKDYFTNLRNHYEATVRNGVPFMNIVLSCGHYAYRCPSKDDMWWQMCSSVTMGASAVSWFFIELPGVWDNYRDAPINQLGDKTQQFYWLREVNCMFNEHMGKVMNTLTIDKCYHVTEAYGGMPLFEPFDGIVDVKANDGTPLIISSFHNAEGERFYAVCNNTPVKSAHVSMKIKGDIKLTQCVYGNRFAPINILSDPIGEQMNLPDQSLGFLLAPGRMMLLKEEKNND